MMTRTNKGLRSALDSHTSNPAHAGLWLDKYLQQQRHSNEKDTTEPAEKLRELLKTACAIPIPEGYMRAQTKRQALLQGLDGGVEGGVTKFYRASAKGRLVIGLGGASVRETSLSLLWTWGTPYLPGSALKGLALRMATEDEKQTLFGDTTSAGFVIFHDAWWIPEEHARTLPLDLDVMTVHHRDYYGEEGGALPTDSDDPNPVPFVTTRGDYRVALTGPAEWVQRAAHLLEQGLETLGLGGKTQAGYGRMTLVHEPTTQEREQEERAKADKRQLDALRDLLNQKIEAGTARQLIEKLQKGIAAGLPAASVYAIAQELGKKDVKFWRNWSKDDRRTEEEKAFMRASGMVMEPKGKA